MEIDLASHAEGLLSALKEAQAEDLGDGLLDSDKTLDIVENSFHELLLEAWDVMVAILQEEGVIDMNEEENA